jgi:hypothetical protein
LRSTLVREKGLMLSKSGGIGVSCLLLGQQCLMLGKKGMLLL